MVVKDLFCLGAEIAHCNYLFELRLVNTYLITYIILITVW